MKEYTGGVGELQIENKDFTSKSLIEKVNNYRLLVIYQSGGKVTNLNI